MALTIYEIKANEGDMVTINERLWLTADQSRIVKDGDPEAAFLFIAAGNKVRLSEIKRLGGLPEAKVSFNDFVEEEEEEEVKEEEEEEVKEEEKEEEKEEYEDWTVKELKEELHAYGLKVSGNKADLIKRLLEAETALPEEE